jgi:succinate-semialdehyde dehydrogenase
MPDFHLATSADAISRNPATGEVIERFPFQTAAEIEKLLTDAQAAFKIWRDMAVSGPSGNLHAVFGWTPRP